MVRGMYTAGTGMMLQRKLMENVTNNITNADTTGYKKEYLVSHSFDDVMINRINDSGDAGQPRQVGNLNLGTQVDQIYVDFESGSFEGTERSTDFALAGDVFFAVGIAAGERYTKCGAFYIDVDGYLTDGEGNYVLGENGPVYTGGLDFTVNENGNVIIDGEVTDRLRIVSFADKNNLRKQGSNLYYSNDAPDDVTGEYKVLQGYLESSNVDISREMVDMLSIYRTYETNQKMLTMVDETVGKAVNDIGRLR